MIKTNPTQVIFNSAVTGTIARISSILAGLISAPIIIAQLGKTEYGLWVLIGQSIGFMAITEFGISGAIGRFFARDKNTQNLEELNRLINTGFGLSLFVTFFHAVTSTTTPSSAHS